MRSRSATEGRAEHIVLPRDKAAQRFYFRFLQSRKLAYFQYPKALQFLSSRLVFRIGQKQRIIEPLTAQLGYNR